MQKAIKPQTNNFILEPPQVIYCNKNNQPEPQIKHIIAQTVQKNQKKKRKQHLIVFHRNNALENRHP